MLDAFAEVLSQRFLLDHDMCRRDESIDERGVVQLDLLLEREESVHMLNTEDLGQKCCPKNLAFAFLIAFAFPSLREGFGCFLLLYRSHIYSIDLCGCKGTTFFGHAQVNF